MGVGITGEIFLEDLLQFDSLSSRSPEHDDPTAYALKQLPDLITSEKYKYKSAVPLLKRLKDSEKNLF